MVCNAIILSRPGHPFWNGVRFRTDDVSHSLISGLLRMEALNGQQVMAQLRQQIDGLLDWGGLTPVDTTGPVFLTRMYLISTRGTLVHN